MSPLGPVARVGQVGLLDSRRTRPREPRWDTEETMCGIFVSQALLRLEDTEKHDRSMKTNESETEQKFLVRVERFRWASNFNLPLDELCNFVAIESNRLLSNFVSFYFMAALFPVLRRSSHHQPGLRNIPRDSHRPGDPKVPVVESQHGRFQVEHSDA